VVEAGGILLGVVASPANLRDDGLLAATLGRPGAACPSARPTPPEPGPCTWTTATIGSPAATSSPVGGCQPDRSRGVPAPVQVGRHGWWSARTPGATASGSCAGVPGGATLVSSSGWCWPAWWWSSAGWSAGPGFGAAGSAALAGHRDALADLDCLGPL